MTDEKHSVLIVEDNPHFAVPLKEMLDSHSLFKVVGVTDSSIKAWDMVKKNMPSVIILDLQLAEGHGFELLKKIRQPNSELAFQPHVLVVTSFSASATQQKIREFADFVIIKSSNYKVEDVVSYLEFMEDEFVDSSEIFANQSLILESSSTETPNLSSSVKDFTNLIESELNEYAIKHSMKGREFLSKAILRALEMPEEETLMMSDLYEFLAENFDTSADSINSAIKRTLKAAFKNTEWSHLLKTYTPYANYKERTRAPGNKEFIIYTANKIKSIYNK